MKSLSLLVCGSAILVGLFAVPATAAQFQVATAGRDYSFTISTGQPWTDTGVDLQTGDVLQFHATSSESCAAPLKFLWKGNRAPALLPPPLLPGPSPPGATRFPRLLLQPRQHRPRWR